MSGSLFSKDWYRIAELKPSLRKHVRVLPHRYRSQRWYVLEDRITGQHRRLSPQAYWIVGLMNGQRTVDELWTLAANKLGEEMPTHEELIQLISSLYQANSLQMDNSGDIAELFEREYEARQNKLLAKLKSPMSIQIPLVDPDRFVERTQAWVAPFFTWAFFAVFVGAMIFLGVNAVQHWHTLTNGISDRVLAADNLLLLWFIYPIIKLLHELGHAYTVRRFGGEVHEMGVMLLVLMPMPYVDASAASAFANKWQRLLVGAVGMIVELLIAAVAMVVWLNAEPGFVKSIAYNVIFIAGISTLMVNGNPLLRFDGYYVLADLIEIPNLAQKANQSWAWLTKKFLFGVQNIDPPSDDWREMFWLIFYGIGSYIYRLFLSVTIVLFIAQKYFFIGILLAIWSVVTVWLWPTFKTIKKAWSDGDITREGRPPNLIMPLLAALLVALLVALPFPLSTSIGGVVQFDEDARVLAGENCFVDNVVQASGTQVAAGDLLLECSSPELIKAGEVSRHQLAEAKARRLGAWNDPVRLKLVDEEIERLNDEINENQRRLQRLHVYANRAGEWWIKNPEDLPGRYIKRGELLGYLAGQPLAKVRGLVPATDVDLVRNRTREVQVLSAATNWQPVNALKWELFPAASKDIHSAVLTKNGGGDIVVDPTANKPMAVEPHFIVDVFFTAEQPALVEQRVYLQFDHPAEGLIYRIYRNVRRTFLDYFDV